jgi:predicted alpha/beta-fold hydrolase
VQGLLACSYLSDYDRLACSSVYGYKDEEEYALAISSLATDDIPIPFLALQPKDDPLHQVNSRCNVIIHKHDYSCMRSYQII